jgi:sulfotransferase famil protein
MRGNGLLHARRPRLHLLHVGKTGGTAIKAALAPHRRRASYELELHEHRTVLRDVPDGDSFSFSTRDPVDRFVSAFYSRQREGRPRYVMPWSDEEAVVFRRYGTANTLAEDLGAEDEVTRRTAEDAMRTIRHVRDPYWRWFEDAEYLRSRADRLLFVMHQERLDEDFARFVELIGLDPARVTLPSDERAAHRNPDDVDRELSDAARANLERWYASDYGFLSLCDALVG